MATIATAIAGASGLDIVTPSTRVHALAIRSADDELFDQFTASAPTTDDTVHDLAQFVLTTAFFDFSKLRAKDIGELLRDGKDLARFKDALVPHAARIPQMSNTRARSKALNEAAQDVISEWEKYKRSLPKAIFPALVDGHEKIEKVVEAAAVGFGFALVAKTAGLALFLSEAATKLIERRNTPFRYLSRIDAALDNSANLFVPAWSKLG